MNEKKGDRFECSSLFREGTLEEFLIFFNLSSTLWISCK